MIPNKKNQWKDAQEALLSYIPRFLVKSHDATSTMDSKNEKAKRRTLKQTEYFKNRLACYNCTATFEFLLKFASGC